jgi:hypothetical protein
MAVYRSGFKMAILGLISIHLRFKRLCFKYMVQIEEFVSLRLRIICAVSQRLHGLSCPITTCGK